MGEPVLNEHSVKGVPPWVARTREVVANLGELADVHLVPVLLKLLQWEGPEVPEARHVKAGVRFLSPILHQSSGYLAEDIYPLSLSFLYLPDTPTPQVVPERAHGAALVLQENELLVR